MTYLAPYLLAGGAAIVMLLGLMHLFYTFRGTKLHPRDAALGERMHEVSPVISRQTTMWRAWVGFNASHSMGAIQFGLIYGYLALFDAGSLFGSAFLLELGLLILVAYLFLAKVYWFSIPFRCIALATALYAAAIVINAA